MMKTLLELMDDELKKMEISEIKGFSSVKEFITSDSKCKEFMKILLKDDIDIPDEESKIYFISKGRASHSIINYLLGRCLIPFGGIYNKIKFIFSENDISEKEIEKLWLLTALYHDIGYLQKDIANRNLDYQKKFSFYLYSDNTDMNIINNFSTIYPHNMAYSYEQILEYDTYDRNRRKETEEKELSVVYTKEEKEKCMRRNAERLNHGIYGGAYLFNRLMKKPLHMKKEQLYIKAVCMCIAQHNIFKSTSDEIDQKLDEYLSLEKLKHNSDFKINEEYPLLLFLSLVDTIECVKKFSKSCNSASFLQTETVLSNVQAEITKEKIELDFSSLLERINERKMLKKEILLDTYKDYFENNIKSLGNWTIYKPYIKEGKTSVKVEIKC